MSERERIAKMLVESYSGGEWIGMVPDSFLAMADAVLADRAGAGCCGYADAERIIRQFTGEKGGHALTQTRLHTMVVRGLRRFIGDHRQPVTRDMIGSAAKRIAEQIRDSIGTILAEEKPDAADMADLRAKLAAAQTQAMDWEFQWETTHAQLQAATARLEGLTTNAEALEARAAAYDAMAERVRALEAAITNHEEAHRVGLANERNFRARAEQAEVRGAALEKFLRLYLAEMGAIDVLHEDRCPWDDTCACPLAVEMAALLAPAAGAAGTGANRQ